MRTDFIFRKSYGFDQIVEFLVSQRGHANLLPDLFDHGIILFSARGGIFLEGAFIIPFDLVDSLPSCQVKG